MRVPYEALLEAAARAPSGDNTQPWRFVVDEAARVVSIELDGGRDPSPMNAGQRMARIAVGAAAENLLRAAALLGMEAEPATDGPAGRLVVRLPRAEGRPGRVEGPLLERVTNRRPYDARPVPPEVLAALSGLEPVPGTRVHWVTDRRRLEPWARLIGRADAAMFREPSIRAAFLKNVRFDAPPGEPVAVGLSLGALELSAADRMALALMTKLPDGLFRVLGLGGVFATKARALVASSSGLCVVCATDRRPETDVAVGRAMQRCWLGLTERGLAAQPMMSLAILDNILEHGTAELAASLGRGRVETLLAESRSLLPEMGGGRAAFVLRFGYAPPPTGRTGRRGLEELVAEVDAGHAAPAPAPLGVAS